MTVAVAVEPVGFDGFFRAYGLYGRIMRMDVASITQMGALCVREGGFGKNAEIGAENGVVAMACQQ